MRIDRETGRTMWETHLAGGQFVNLQVNDGGLFASTRGELWCLDPDSGAVRWRNGLPGMGWGIVTIAGDNDNTAAQAQLIMQQQQAAAASST